MFAFERLIVYEKSLQLVKDIYAITKLFPETEKISVPSNIAEGVCRMSTKEKTRFIEIAYGSLMEVYCQIQIAQKLNYIQEPVCQELRSRMIEISKMLNSLKYSYEK